MAKNRTQQFQRCRLCTSCDGTSSRPGWLDKSLGDRLQFWNGMRDEVKDSIREDDETWDEDLWSRRGARKCPDAHTRRVGRDVSRGHSLCNRISLVAIERIVCIFFEFIFFFANALVTSEFIIQGRKISTIVSHAKPFTHGLCTYEWKYYLVSWIEATLYTPKPLSAAHERIGLKWLLQIYLDREINKNKKKKSLRWLRYVGHFEGDACRIAAHRVHVESVADEEERGRKAELKFVII